MIQGFPGETAEDLDLSADFLERNGNAIDRLRLSKFSVPEGTPIFRTIGATADAFNDVRVIAREPELARLRYVNGSFSGRAYRRAKLRLLHAVHQINRREVRESARTFDGMM